MARLIWPERGAALSGQSDDALVIIAQFRAYVHAYDGTADFPGPVIVMTTAPAKSGRPRTTPLCHSTDGDRLVVIASAGGTPTHPDWFNNLVAPCCEGGTRLLNLPGVRLGGRGRRIRPTLCPARPGARFVS